MSSYQTEHRNSPELVAAECVLGEMLHSPLQNYIAPGLTSFLVGGETYGKVRLFHSDRDQREFITPHSHRFNFACIVIAGSVQNVLFEEQDRQTDESNAFVVGDLRRAGEFGEYTFAPGDRPVYFRELRRTYEAGDFYSMKSNEIHSICFGRNACVLFLEGPEVSESSVVLEPWSNNRRVPTFETRSWMFQRPQVAPNFSQEESTKQNGAGVVPSAVY